MDTASYANVRRFLKSGQWPPKGAVRVEEMINYFAYDYPGPEDGRPFAVHFESAACPWQSGHRMVRIGLRGQGVDRSGRKPANLVFLIDVSGSMSSQNKLPLLKKSLQLAVNQLSPRDRIAMVVYAGASGLVLPSTGCDDKPAILSALDQLYAGGSTNGASGIELAYQVAVEHYIKGGINRVILATDGDFNVGVTRQSDLVDRIQRKAKSGVFLTVLGFGMGNYKDATLEKLADKGNGTYGYIDTFSEARKVFSDQLDGTLQTIATDVKIQVEFNPAKVKAYRLVGYENRKLAHADFNDDTKDAGEIGANHRVTVLYQVVPKGVPIGVQQGQVDDLKYQKSHLAKGPSSGELMTVKLRYKLPHKKESTKLTYPIADRTVAFEQASRDFQFATAVAAFGMVLRDSKYKGDAQLEQIIAIASRNRGEDAKGYRAEFVRLAKAADQLSPVRSRDE